MENIQQSLIELQKREDNSRELATLGEEDSVLGGGLDSQQPPGLAAATSGEKSEPQPFTGWGMTADSVKSCPVNLCQINVPDSDESVIVGKRDLSPARLRGFAPPHVDGGRVESTMKFKAPKKYNPANMEPTIRT